MTEQQKQESVELELHRLRSHYESRRAEGRPVPYSVAAAYRKLIDEKERLAKR